VTTDRDRTPTDASRELLREFRRVTAFAVGELRSQEVRNTYSSISLEELTDQQIERLLESEDPLNPSRLQRLRQVRDSFANAIDAIKATPPEAFQRHDPENDANTAPGDEE
jgi:hypothetical protein